jgi:BASS family bile acid:Na+ symporter
VLFAGSVVLLVVLAPFVLMRISWLDALAFVLTIVVSLVIGHVLGGPRPDHRIPLAMIASTRNLGLALMIAGATLPEHLPVQVLIVAYTVLTQILHIPYLRWAKRAAERHAGVAPAAPA